MRWFPALLFAAIGAAASYGLSHRSSLSSAEKSTERECARRRRQLAHIQDPLRRQKKIERILKRTALLVGLEEARGKEKLYRAFARDASFKAFREDWTDRAAFIRGIRRTIKRHLQQVGGLP